MLIGPNGRLMLNSIVAAVAKGTLTTMVTLPLHFVHVKSGDSTPINPYTYHEPISERLFTERLQLYNFHRASEEHTRF